MGRDQSYFIKENGYYVMGRVNCLTEIKNFPINSLYVVYTATYFVMFRTRVASQILSPTSGAAGGREVKRPTAETWSTRKGHRDAVRKGRGRCGPSGNSSCGTGDRGRVPGIPG